MVFGQFHLSVTCKSNSGVTKQVYVQTSTAPVNVTLLAFAAERLAAGLPPLSIDICCQHGAHQRHAEGEQWDRQTECELSSVKNRARKQEKFRRLRL